MEQTNRTLEEEVGRLKVSGDQDHCKYRLLFSCHVEEHLSKVASFLATLLVDAFVTVVWFVTARTVFWGEVLSRDEF